MTLLNVFSDEEPKHTTHHKYANPSPELKAGALNLLFFEWFSSTTWKGFRRPLTEEDIYDVNPEYATKELAPAFDKYFNQSIRKNEK